MSLCYSKRLAEAGIDPSVGSIGDSYDNALAETVIGLFKVEVIHRHGPWRSFETVEFAMLDWFNHRRLFEPIGNIPSAEAEARYCAQVEVKAVAAYPKSNGLRETRGGSAAETRLDLCRRLAGLVHAGELRLLELGRKVVRSRNIQRELSEADAGVTSSGFLSA